MDNKPVIEVCREHRLPLVLTFVDYEKAFDNVETNAILSALVDQEVDASYVRTLADCYIGCSTTIQLSQRPLTIPIAKGVPQGDTLSRRLFTAALLWAIKSLDWEEKGIWVASQIFVLRMILSSSRKASVKRRRCFVS
ncbi:hypothetical protein ANCCAN_22896 [Ancylostoma caninum]|uniref:Reverse transcriptase domain-containing protein n=1 Tax=Ancylostoma caninum TaxID=29170 RepID=A0A368FKD3_ANCCA|nr:hypothetical protein ANCCAN_22896 [Ancylostoma caninum]